MPLFLFSVLFGLSMDYQVFLLSRIRERYDADRRHDDAVTFGVASTARIITGAALIIVAVFAGFARGELIMFQQMGFGVAVALLIDATIIRSVLLPERDEAARRLELVPATLARMAPPPPGRRQRAQAAPNAPLSNPVDAKTGPVRRRSGCCALRQRWPSGGRPGCGQT